MTFPLIFPSPRRHPPFPCPNCVGPTPTASASDVSDLTVFLRPSSRHPEVLALSLSLSLCSLSLSPGIANWYIHILSVFTPLCFLNLQSAT